MHSMTPEAKIEVSVETAGSTPVRVEFAPPGACRAVMRLTPAQARMVARGMIRAAFLGDTLRLFHSDMPSRRTAAEDAALPGL